MNVDLRLGDCREKLKELQAGSVHCGLMMNAQHMSYREWLAGLAMQGMQFNGDYDGGTLDASEKRQKLARTAFAVADAMIKESNTPLETSP